MKARSASARGSARPRRRCRPDRRRRRGTPRSSSPLESSHRSNTGPASSVNRHIRSSASLGSSGRHLLDDGAALRLQVVHERLARLPIDEAPPAGDRCRAASAPRGPPLPGSAAPASSSRRRRLIAASPVLISISSSASRSAPSAFRFFALSVVFAAMVRSIPNAAVRQQGANHGRLAWPKLRRAKQNRHP